MKDNPLIDFKLWFHGNPTYFFLYFTLFLSQLVQLQVQPENICFAYTK